jgi:alkylation response protein AidB-like acyl-CoA dehydrogenase
MQRRIDGYLERLLDEDRFAFYQSVAAFAESEVAPKLLQWERSGGLLPDSIIARMAELGLFGLTIETERGGQGGGQLELVLMGLALGYHSHSVAITPGAAASLGTKPIQLFGSEAQKRALLPDVAAGKAMIVFGLTEPGRGSDAANPETTARRSNGGFVIRGEKAWMTNAKWAKHVVVHALTDPAGKKGHRSTCFVLPMDTKGVRYNEMGGKLVWRQSSTGSIAFEDVFVRDDAILGELNGGFRVMAETLNGGRLFIAGLALASVAFALDRCRSYAQERMQFDDQPIGRFQRVQDVILDLDIALESGLTWLVHLLDLYQKDEMSREQASKIKIECSRRASHLLVEAMEVCGGVACLDEFGLIRHHNDLFVTRVGEGSNRALKSQATRPLMPGLPGMQ